MKKLLMKLCILSFSFVLLALFSGQAKASSNDLAGTYVWVGTNTGTPLANIPVWFGTNTGGTWPYVYGAKACQGQAFDYLPDSPDTFFGSLTFWTAGHGWALSRDPARYGAVLTGGGITYSGQYGFSCYCNPLRMIVYDYNKYGYVFDWAAGATVVNQGTNWVELNINAPQNDSIIGPGGAPSVYVALKPATQGWHDSASDCQTSGWARDLRNLNYQSAIHIYEGTSTGVNWSKYKGQTNANVYRADVGAHGFNYVFPANDSIRDNNVHWLWAYAFSKDGTPYQLNATPKSIKCSVSSPTTSPTTIPPASCSFTVNDVNAVTVGIGNPVTFRWSNAGGADIIEKIAGSSSTNINVSGRDSIQVVPSETATYRLKKSSDGSYVCSPLTVTVTPNSSGSVQPVAP